MAIDLGEILERSGAILHGHFLLTSGRHSPIYFEKFRVLEQPEILSALCAELVEKLQGISIDVVAGPTTGGIIIAFEVARQMGLPALYIESENGERKLRRNASLKPGTRVLIVDDVLTTGKSLREVAICVENHGASVAHFGVLIDRSEGDLELNAPLARSYRVDAQSYPADGVPDWLVKIPVTKPGSRHIMEP